MPAVATLNIFHRQLHIETLHKTSEGDVRVISVNANGDRGISFNSERMHCAWMSSDMPMQVKIF